jgi:hypothetical protein
MSERSSAIRSTGGSHNTFIGNVAHGYDTAVGLEDEQHAVTAFNRAHRAVLPLALGQPRRWRLWAGTLVLTLIATIISDLLLHWLPLP